MSDSMLYRTTQMNIDQQSFFKPISKFQTRLRPDRVGATVYQAYEIAVSERPGPVYIGLPAGMGTVEAAEEHLGPLILERVPPANQTTLAVMQDIFKKSRRPLLAVGITSIRAQVRSLIRQIAERFQVPVVLTPMAKGIMPEDHPCYAGVLAHALADHVGLTHQQADLIVGIGYDPVEINYEDWVPDVPIMHLDTSPADLDRSRFTLGCDVVGDLNYSLRQLEVIECSQKDWDLNSLAQRRKKMFARLEPVEGSFDPRAVLAGLREKLPRDGIMTCDVGAHLHLIGQQWPTPSPECQIMTNGCSSMGFGIPAAIAAKLGCPDREVCCVSGDGGFLMMVGEMATVLRLGIKVIFVVMSDKDLSLIRIKQERKGCKPYGTRLMDKDHILSDNFFGVPVLGASNIREYRDALDKAFAAVNPVIIIACVTKADYDRLILRGNK
jgi:acetolactate synthase-1/2/3 large subunit